MADVVLVHGAFRGPWAWERVAPLLEAADHRVVAADLTAPDATLASYIDTLDALVQANSLGGVTLVGHSQGGFVARAASQRLAARLRRLVHLDAPVPRHGECAFDFRPAGSPPPEVARGDVVEPRRVAPGEGLSAADAAWINDRLVPQPVAPSMEPVVLDDLAALSLPETHVFFERTPDDYPCAITRRRLDAAGTPYTLIDAPHDAIVTHPITVADLLLALLP